MFLGNLTEEQKPHFLSLAAAVVLADGVLGEAEVTMLEQYKQEMALPPSADISTEPVSQAIEAFQSASVTVKKQIVFELLGLSYADNDYSPEEEKLLREIALGLGLDAVFLKESQRCIEELNSLYGRIRVLVSD